MLMRCGIATGTGTTREHNSGATSFLAPGPALLGNEAPRNAEIAAVM